MTLTHEQMKAIGAYKMSDFSLTPTTPEDARKMVLEKHPTAVIVPTFKHDCGWICIYNRPAWFRRDQVLLGEAKDEDGGEPAAWINAAQRLEDK